MSTIPLDKLFKLVDNQNDLEPGAFYTVNKDGSFMKNQDGIESVPAKEWTEEEYNAAIASSKLNKFLNTVFSTTGLAIILIVIVIVGVALGLLPLIISKTKTRDIEILSQNSTFLETILLSTQQTTSVTSQITTIPETTTQAPTTLITTPVVTTTQQTTLQETTVQTTIQTTVITTTAFVTTAKTCIVDENPKSYIPSTYNLNSCPTTSIYVPSFLTLSTSYNFEYPIIQTIACTGSKVELRCPTNQVIHIYSAYYGIQSNTNTFLCSPSSSNQEICYFDLTYSNITTLCENNNYCQLSVTVGSFGDPCIGSLNKQLFIQYQCVDSSGLTTINTCTANTNKESICPAIKSGQNDQYWCDVPASFTLSCSGGKVLKILCAFYGIDPNLRCSGSFYYGAPSACYSKSSFTKVRDMCDGQTSCNFQVDTTFEDYGFINVCQGFQNMLYIQWECVSTTDATTSEPPTTEFTLPFCNTTETINGTCAPSTYSPYEPEYLTNSTNTYFNYPIYQQIVCQGSRLIIVCPTNLVIHIYSAYYGIQSLTTSSCTTSLSETPDKCYFSNAFNTIFTACEYKNSCQLRATSNSLGGGDLCPSNQKQLLVQYQCMETLVLNTSKSQCNETKSVPLICPAIDTSLVPKVQESTWCDGSTMSITCTNSTQKIKIVCAFYGLHPTLTTCNVPSLVNKPVCYFASSSTYVKAQCDGKNSCSIGVFSSTFTNDPCVGLDKALYIQWRCIT